MIGGSVGGPDGDAEATDGADRDAAGVCSSGLDPGQAKGHDSDCVGTAHPDGVEGAALAGLGQVSLAPGLKPCGMFGRAGPF